MSALDIINGKFSSTASTSSDRPTMYKRGVKVRYMSGQKPIRFRLLPAFDPENPNAESSIAPWVYSDGTPSDWVNMIIAAKFVGGQRASIPTMIVCRETFGDACPYRKLYNIATKDNDWKYLTERGKTLGAVLPPPRKLMLMNILDIDAQDRGSQVGEFSHNAAKTLFDRDSGIMWTLNPQFTEDLNELNYMQQFVYGDLTCPEYGLVLRLDRDTSSPVGGYRINIDTDETRRAYRWPIGEDVLASRANLADINNVVNEQSGQEIVDILAGVLNQRCETTGYHEYALLKMALGDEYKVPEPPSAPGATNTVQGVSLPPPPPPPAATQPRPVTRPQAMRTVAPASPVAPVATPATPPPPPAIPGIPGETISEDLLAQLRR